MLWIVTWRTTDDVQSAQCDVATAVEGSPAHKGFQPTNQNLRLLLHHFQEVLQDGEVERGSQHLSPPAPLVSAATHTQTCTHVDACALAHTHTHRQDTHKLVSFLESHAMHTLCSLKKNRITTRGSGSVFWCRKVRIYAISLFFMIIKKKFVNKVFNLHLPVGSIWPTGCKPGNNPECIHVPSLFTLNPKRNSKKCTCLLIEEKAGPSPT